MPTIHDTWDQLDKEPIKLAWKEQVDHKGFELAWRVEESRLAREAKKKLGYMPKWLGGPGPSAGFVQRLCERRYNENPTQDLILARPKFLQELVCDLEEPHVSKWIDALFQTWRKQCTNGRETPEFLWAIFCKGVADEISKREALLSSGSLFVRARKHLESVRDQVELEAHKLQHAQFRGEASAAQPVTTKKKQDRRRKRDPQVAERDELIVTLRDVTYAGLTGINRNKKIAYALAEQNKLPPRHWGIQSFKDAPRYKPQELHQMISKAHV